MTLHTEIDQSFTIYRNSNDKSMGSITFPIGQLDALQSSLMRLQMELKETEAQKMYSLLTGKEHAEIQAAIDKAGENIIVVDPAHPIDGEPTIVGIKNVAKVADAMAADGESIIVDLKPVDVISDPADITATNTEDEAAMSRAVSKILDAEDPGFNKVETAIKELADGTIEYPTDILDMTKLQLLRFLASFEIFSYSMDDSKAELLDAAAAASRDKKEE